jgi:hypothetical protein
MTKECPACGAEVPTSATRCKECFHDFTEQGPRPINMLVGPLIVLGAIAALSVVGALILLFVFMQPIEERVLVDQDTRSIVWTTKYRTGIQTDRVMFDQVTKVEHIGHGGTFQVIAITMDGDRKIVQEDQRPLDSEGRHYAKLMEKPFEDVDPAAKKH